jgi:hypothetical protein
VSTVVSAGILSFSTVVTGKVTAPFTFYATAAGIAAAFVSVFWSFGYIRLSERLRKTAKNPAKVFFVSAMPSVLHCYQNNRSRSPCKLALFNVGCHPTVISATVI